jgi:hypothetical protein
MSEIEILAERIRTVIGHRENVAEVDPGEGAWMAATAAWSVNERMAVMVRGDGGLMILVAKDDHARFGLEPGAEPLRMNPRGFGGWIHVDVRALESDTALAEWVMRGVDFAATIPRLDDF